jgi:hypothetical protein
MAFEKNLQVLNLYSVCSLVHKPVQSMIGFFHPKKAEKGIFGETL